MNGIVPSDLPRFPSRNVESHKGDYGRVLLVGGSRGMSGAIALAGLAALRAGAGLVRLAIPEPSQTAAASIEPSYMTLGLPADAAGQFAAAALPPLRAACEWANVVGVGPGLGRSNSCDLLAQSLYEDFPLPAVFDADALNALAARSECFGRHAGPRVLTPHPGELRRLLQMSAHTSRDALVDAAHQFAEKTQTIVIVKGAGSVITDGNRRVTNATGNPGLATGGTGDVLTGIVAALLAQGLPPFDAARLGAYVHGLAGDLAARDLGETSLIASDLPRYLPKAIQRMAGVP